MRDVLALLLHQSGYDVACAENGEDALGLLRDGLTPSAILLDYHMPTMDGRDFRQRQLQEGLMFWVPVLLYTADPTIAAQDLNVAAILRKPLEFDVILALVEQVCGGAQPGLAPRGSA